MCTIACENFVATLTNFDAATPILGCALSRIAMLSAVFTVYSSVARILGKGVLEYARVKSYS
jgi:hypothetical protein